MLAFLIKACVAALKEFPEFNASLDGDDLIVKRYYNIGFAADTPNGLVVPVVKDADGKGIIEIANEMGELSGAARAGKLKPGDMAGGNFTISSLGGIGGTSFTPIVNAPEVAILGVVRSAMKPVWDGSEFVPRLMLPLSLSYDHRVIDGAAAARFVKYLVSIARGHAEGAAVNEVKVPDIGDFTDVPVIEILVAAGRHRRSRGPADHARVRQGDDGRALAVRRRRQGAERRGRRHGLGGQLILHARGGGRGERATRDDGEPPAVEEPAARRRRRRAEPAARRRRARPTWSCSAPAPAATPPRSAPPTSA